MDDFLMNFSRGMIPNPNEQGHQEVFSFYISRKFKHANGNQWALVQENVEKTFKFLTRNRELKKEPFRNFIIKIREPYPSTEELEEFLQIRRRSAANVLANLFQVDANQGYWKKVLGYTAPERFATKEKDKQERNDLRKKTREHFASFFDERFPRNLRGQLKDKNIPVETRVAILYEYLMNERMQLLREGKATRAVSQAIVDLVYTHGYHDPLLLQGLKSDDALTRIESFRMILKSAESFAMRLGYKNFDDLIKTMQVLEPTGGIPRLGHLFLQLEKLENDVVETAKPSLSVISKTVRHLSLFESPLRGCLSDYDCATGTYLLKALDPNYHYFTLTDDNGISHGNITVVLGSIQRNPFTESVNAAFVDKVQGLSGDHDILPIMMEVVRRSMEGKGYRLVVPKKMGNPLSGISNSSGTALFIKNKVHKSKQKSVFMAYWNKYQYKLRSGDTRAKWWPFVAEVLPLKLPEQVEILPADRPAAWEMSDVDFKKWGHILTLLKEGDTEDKITYIHFISQQSLDEDSKKLLLSLILDINLPFSTRKEALLFLLKDGSKSLANFLPFFNDQEKKTLIQKLILESFYNEQLSNALYSPSVVQDFMIYFPDKITSHTAKKILVLALNYFPERVDIFNETIIRMYEIEQSNLLEFLELAVNTKQRVDASIVERVVGLLDIDLGLRTRQEFRWKVIELLLNDKEYTVIFVKKLLEVTGYSISDMLTYSLAHHSARITLPVFKRIMDYFSTDFDTNDIEQITRTLLGYEYRTDPLILREFLGHIPEDYGSPLLDSLKFRVHLAESVGTPVCTRFVERVLASSQL